MSQTRDRRHDERLLACLAWFERYDGLWDDPRAFRAAIASPPPVDLLVPPGGPAPDRVRAMLERRGLPCEAFPWAPHHLRVSGWSGAGTLPAVVFGFAFPQGVVSSLPPQLLAPRPGETVLDACAAPGGKTVLLAALGARRARIVAGDVTASRAGLLVQILARGGVASAIVVRQDAAAFPVVSSFEKVMLDAPCSGEGTCRLPRLSYRPGDEQGLARAAAIQSRLLARGLDLLAPGGRLVYSTCTFAPEENEAVLSRVLGGRDEIDLEQLPADVPGQPGVPGWNGQLFDPRVTRARRIGPQHTGSWGFFVARLVKDESAAPVRRPSRYGPPEPPAEDAGDRALFTGYLARRFGVDASTLEDHLVLSRGRDLWLLSRPSPGVPDVDIGRLSVIAPGLRALRRTGRGARVTTGALRWLDERIAANVVDIDLDRAAALLDGTNTEAPPGLDDGQVAVRCEGKVVCGGFVHHGRLELEVPKAWR